MHDHFSFYGLSPDVFEPSRTQDGVFRSALFKALLRKLIGEGLAGRAVTVVHGGRGVGKTTLMEALAVELDARDAAVVQVANSSVSPLMLQGAIGRALGVGGAASFDPVELVRTASSGTKPLVVLIDDAQVQPSAIFRYVQLILDLSSRAKIEMRVIFFGAFGRWNGWDHPDLSRMRESAMSGLLVRAMREEEAVAYLDHKFSRAGRTLKKVMTRPACAEVIALTDGVPGRLQEMTELVLHHGHARGSRLITLDVVRSVLPAVAREPLQRRVATRVFYAGMAVVAAAVVAGGAAELILDFAAPPRAPAIRMAGPRDVPPVAAPTPLVAAKAHPVATPGAIDLARPPPVAEAAAGAPAAAAPTPAPGLAAPRAAVARVAGLAQIGAVPAAVSPTIAPGVAAPRPVVSAAAAPVHPVGPPALTPAAPAPPPSGAKSPPLMKSQVVVASNAPPQPREPATTPPLHGGPGLVLVAGVGDTMATLYARVYRGVLPPPYETVVAANRLPVRPGSLVIFPEPPAGWSSP